MSRISKIGMLISNVKGIICSKNHANGFTIAF